MNTEKIKRFLPLLLTTVLLVLALVGLQLTHASVAWFSRNNAVSANGISIKGELPILANAEIECHTVIGKTGDTVFFDKEIGEPIIPKYDLLDDTMRHLLLRINVTPAVPIVFSVMTETKHFMDGRTDGDEVHPLLGAKDNYLSNIVSFAEVSATSAEYGSADAYAVTLPSEAISLAAEDPVSGNMKMSESAVITSGERGEFFILISYNEDNITRLYSENIGNPIFSNEEVLENGVSYSMDFTFDIR